MQTASIKRSGGALEVATVPKLPPYNSCSVRLQTIGSEQRFLGGCTLWTISAKLAAVILLLLFQTGCSKNTEFEQLSELEAFSRLREVLGTTDSSVKLLKQGVHPNSGSEFWIITTVDELNFSSKSEVQGPTPCPDDSVFSYAVSLGVPASSIEPPASTTQPPTSAGSSQQARLWQWQIDGFSVRVRQVRLKNGALAVVELLREKNG